MIRTLAIASICAVFGVGLGWVQASYMDGGIEERFLGSRLTMAERSGELSRDEIVRQAKLRPKLEIEGGTSFQFGMMMHGEEMSHSFVVRNVGDGPLLLEMGESSCKCTVGDLDKSILQPGEQTDVTLTWKALAVTHDFGQSATLLTNDPDQSEVKLQVMGEIAQSFVVEPSAIELGYLANTQTVSRTFHVFAYLEDAETLTDFEWGDTRTREFIDIDVERIEIDPEQFPKHKNALAAHRVDLSIKPGMPLGPVSSRIQFKTDQDENVGTLGVIVKGNVSGPLELQGGPSFDAKLSLLKLGNVKSSEGASVSILLFVQGDQRDKIVPEILSVEPAEALHVEIGEPRKTASRTVYPLRFEVPKGAPEVYYPAQGGNSHGRVLIGTGGSQAQELPINVRLVVTK